jgi:hypothetical protein
MGRGEAFIGMLEQRAQRMVSATEIEGVSLRMGRAPLSRVAYLSGPADRFQREGLGSFPGIDRRITRVPGIARVVWTNPPPDERS